MDKDILNIDEIAVMLSLHPRTIRRYLKAGTLKGTKIGGEWRIKRSDLQVMLGNPEVVNELRTTWDSGVAEFLSVKQNSLEAGCQICTIVDCNFSGSEEAQDVSSALLGIVNLYKSGKNETRFQYSYNSETGKARFILWGSPDYIIQMMQALPDNLSRED